MSKGHWTQTFLEHLSDAKLVELAKTNDKKAEETIRNAGKADGLSPESAKILAGLQKEHPRMEIRRRKEARRELGLPEGLEI